MATIVTPVVEMDGEFTPLSPQTLANYEDAVDAVDLFVLVLGPLFEECDALHVSFEEA